MNTISGDNGKREPPVPIPNTEVKPLRADGTWLATARESRSSPDSKEPVIKVAGSNFMYLSPDSKRKRGQRNSVERKEPAIRVTDSNFICLKHPAGVNVRFILRAILVMKLYGKWYNRQKTKMFL